MKHTKPRPGSRPSSRPGPRPHAHSRTDTSASAKDSLWIWGTHAVLAALRNPARVCLKLYASKNAAAGLPQDIEVIPANPQEITGLLPEGAVHQGLALQTRALPAPSLEDIMDKPKGLLLMLDSVTDPRNVGAILRSAAAFGADGLIMQDRKIPPLSGVLAKAAVGALETVPIFAVVNLARTLEDLGKSHWQSVGLAGGTKLSIAKVLDADKTCLVLGSEGDGLRPNVAKHCDILAHIPIDAAMESLNVSNAAAIALYEAART